MATVRVGSIVLRVDDLQRQMAFWMAALDYVPREDPDVDSVVLRPRTGSGPNLTLDQHPAQAPLPPRIHSGSVHRRSGGRGPAVAHLGRD